MTRPRLRGVVLCAGLGSRLAPLTDTIPKPLLSIRGRTVVERTLDRLEHVGCEAVALNLHHLGAAIREKIGDRHGVMAVEYSDEADILGTLGALAALRGFLAEADFVFLVNGDSVCPWPLEELLQRHRDRLPRATLLLNRSADAAAFGGVGVDGDDRITFWPGGAPSERTIEERVFAGAHVFAPSLVENAERRFSSIGDDLYVGLLKRDEELQGLSLDLDWHDLGTPARLLSAVASRNGWVAATASIDGGAVIEASTIEEGARVGRAARVTRSLILPAARVEPGARVLDSIVGPGVVVPEGGTFERMMLTADPRGALSLSPVERS